MLAISIAFHAGCAIMRICESNLNRRYKSSNSPATAIDLKSNEIICHVQELPILKEVTWTAVSSVEADTTILINSLESTEKFIRGSSEVTVNSDHSKSVPCSVYSTAKRRLWAAGSNAYRLEVTDLELDQLFYAAPSVEVNQPSNARWRIVFSHLHPDPATRWRIDQHAVSQLKPFGSYLDAPRTQHAKSKFAMATLWLRSFPKGHPHERTR